MVGSVNDKVKFGSTRLETAKQLLYITQGCGAEPLNHSSDALIGLRYMVDDTDKRQLLNSQRNDGHQFTARVERAEPLK